MAVLIDILLSLLAVGGIGAATGIGFALASGKGKRDRLLVQAEAALPGLNCGVCGYSGCADYAKAVKDGEAAPALCLPGGEKVSKTLAKLLGVEVSYRKENSIVQVHCRGGKNNAVYRFDYRGLDDCTALHLLFGGDKACKFSCLGLGSCIKVCPEGALGYDEDSLVRVDPAFCTGCGICLEVCPTGVLRSVPRNADYIVACNSTDKGDIVKAYCKAGCTACRACERRSPEGGFEVDNYLARINYKKRGERKNAEIACPSRCVVPLARNDAAAADSSETEKHAKT